MITLITRQKRKQWKTAAALFVLLFGLAQCVAIAEESIAEAVDSNEVIMVHNVWVDTPLTQAFRDISMETGVIIATCPHVPDPLVSLDAGSGKPLAECLQVLVAGRGLFVYQKNKRFYLVSWGQPTCPSFLEIADPKRLYLKYITAKHFKACLPKSVQQYVSSGQRPNEVLIYAVPETVKHIMEIVDKLDVPRRQVVLEVLVVELWNETGKEFGLDWEYENQDVSVSMSHGLKFFTGIAKYTSVPADEFTKLLFTLKMLVGEGKASIRSRPRVATLNGGKAAIDISLDEYFSIVTDLGYSGGSLRTQLQIIKSGVRLQMTPHIGDNNNITVDVVIEVSDVASRRNQVAGNNSGNLPVIRRRKADTCVRVKEGDAIVIGGLIETQEQNSLEKVPILGDIPLVGGLFHSTKSNTIEKEVIIFITPRLMKEGKLAFSGRHNLLDVAKERESLRRKSP